MRRIERILWTLIATMAPFISAAGENAAAPNVETLEKRADAAFERGEPAEALEALDQALNHEPEDAQLLYESAAALAQTDRPDAATERLTKAITHGFVDFFRMQRDTRLAPIREHKRYRTIIRGWRELLDARGDRNLKAAKELFGPRYSYRRDENLRLIYASAFDPQSFKDAREEIDAIAEWSYGRLFQRRAEDDPRPHPWVTVILPRPEDFVQFMRKLGAGPNVGGLYDNDRRQLISRDLGSSLRHEFFHVLHWRAMNERGQRHPDWIMEGLGALVEDVRVELGQSGSIETIEPVLSWRINIAKRLERLGRLHPWRRLMTMERKRFRGVRPNANYAQARAVMLFLHRREKLGDWFRAYLKMYDEDPWGMAALERVFGEPLETIEQRYKEWLAGLPEVAEEIEPGMASLGVVVTPGRGDGPQIDQIVAGTEAGDSGLRMRDVILEIDNRPTRTLPALVRVLSGYEPGDVVEVTVRRGTRRLTLDVTLTAR